MYLARRRRVAGTPAEVITTETLTRLYGVPIEVLRATDGRLVVVGQPEAPFAATATAMTTEPRSSRGCPGTSSSDVRQLFAYHFMVNALEAGTVVAVMAAAIGWFMVLRRQTFAGHTLSVIAFPGRRRRERSRACRSRPATSASASAGALALAGVSADRTAEPQRASRR